MRTICVSNRVSLPDPVTGQIKAGGLAVGVREALRAQGGGVWFGWNGKLVNSAADREKQGVEEYYDPHNKIQYLTIPLTESEHDSYYKGMANQGLWPFMHELGDKIEEDGSSYKTYRHVNNVFAKMLQPYIQPDDVLWVHDYHMMPLGHSLRQTGVQNKILFFNHIPVPSTSFTNMPIISTGLRTQYDELMSELFAYDQVGFQSRRDLENFLEQIESPQTAAAFSRFEAQQVTRRGNGVHTNVGIFPISIETDDLEQIAKDNESSPRVQKFLRNLQGKKLIIGAERLDYTKGLIERINGVSEFLRKNPEHIGEVVYTQITPLSRDEISAYKSIIDSVRRSVTTVNATFGDECWQPILYSEKSIERSILAAYFRQASVGLVTPLMDGQNLVAKEFLASQNPEDPGVLVLSQFAGAAEELGEAGALLIDPKKPGDIAEKIKTALVMPADERVETHANLMGMLRNNDIRNWAHTFLTPYLT